MLRPIYLCANRKVKKTRVGTSHIRKWVRPLILLLCLSSHDSAAHGNLGGSANHGKRAPASSTMVQTPTGSLNASSTAPDACPTQPLVPGGGALLLRGRGGGGVAGGGSSLCSWSPPRNASITTREAASSTLQARVMLRVTAETKFGEEVYICGSDATIGAWDLSMAVKMATSPSVYPHWMVRLLLPRSGNEVLYKYVMKEPSGQFKWECIPNRGLALAPHVAETVIHDGAFNNNQQSLNYQWLVPPTVPPPPACR